MGTFMHRLSGNAAGIDPSVNAATLDGLAAADLVAKGEADSVDSSMIADGPGIAQTIVEPTAVVSSGVQTMADVTITAPADGYAVVTGSSDTFLIHTNGALSFGFVGVSDNNVDFADDENIDIIIPADAGSGTYGRGFSMTKVFPVTEGDNTFYFLAQPSVGSLQVGDIHLVALYLPSSVGTVDVGPSVAAELSEPESR